MFFLSIFKRDHYEYLNYIFQLGELKCFPATLVFSPRSQKLGNFYCTKDFQDNSYRDHFPVLFIISNLVLIFNGWGSMGICLQISST